MTQSIQNLLSDVVGDGGRAMVTKGQYGQGKTFALKLLEELALEAGFVVVRTEIDATENRLNKPHHIYRDLMAHLRVPGVTGSGQAGMRALAARTAAEISEATRAIDDPDELGMAGRGILLKELGCRPLAWLLSDPDVATKDELLGLWACDPNVNTSAARRGHRVRGDPRDWPAFNAGTQGDFASYLLSGLGRLCRYVGHKGLVIVMDEMEKWQDLNWKEQSQAGNLLGGLVWGATAEGGKRGRADRPRVIYHSLRAGGFPFTTAARNHVGIAIAMTPRGEDSPEALWQQYGLLEVAYLPELTEQRLTEYCGRLAPHYAAAYGLSSPPSGQLAPVVRRAVATWKRVDRNCRTADQFVRVLALPRPPEVPEGRVRAVLEDMVQQGLLDRRGQVYQPASPGWEFIQSSRIYSNLEPTPPEVTLVDADTGNVVATVADVGGRHVRVAGRSYEVLPGGGPGERKVRGTGSAASSPAYHAAKLPYAADLGAAVAGRLGVDPDVLAVVPAGGGIVLFTFLGKFLNTALAGAMVAAGRRVKAKAFSIVVEDRPASDALALVAAAAKGVVDRNPFGGMAAERMVDVGPHFDQLSARVQEQAREDWLDPNFLACWAGSLRRVQPVEGDSELGRDLLQLN